VYFTRLLRDFPAGPYRTRGLLWLTRSYFDERNLTGGCTALDSLRRVEIPDGELKLQSDELQRRCVGVPRTVSPVAPPAVSPPAVAPPPAATPVAATPVAGSGRYSVQLAAYFTRAEAVAAVQRFTQRDIAARVDGEQKPFRVRVGYYATRAEAASALSRLKKLGLDGFVAELAP
jgi:hypothetical protein